MSQSTDLIGQIIESTFQFYDRDKSGFLEKNEVKQLLKEAFLSEEIEISPEFEQKLEESLEEFIKHIDGNKDGRVSKEELKSTLEPYIMEIFEKEE
jgi:Ca2+-binding EF-hand superfamily protein